MSTTNLLSRNTRPLALGFLALVCTVLSACGKAKEEEVQLVPVSGKVTVDGKILPMGNVYYQPDESKGNKSTKVINGHIQSDGTYKLVTVTESGALDGAPVGWYKVTVNVGPPTTEEQRTMKVEPYNESFKRPKTTKLIIEVKEGAKADAYDLKLTR